MFATKWAKFGAGTLAAATLGTTGVVTVDQAQNPYEDKETHYELPIKADFEQGERVEIAKDKAQMTLKGWNDEYAITITPQIPTTSFGAIDKPFNVPADRKLLSKKMEYRTGDVTAFIEPKEGTGNEFDIDFTLHSRPDTNVFTYKIEGAEDFDWFYQGELTAEEIAEGASRPENVVGSYAVYHKTKANHRVGSTNYATGKAFHIYRPKAIDANGAEVWAQLSYSEGVLSVAVPDKWLQNAAYPVRVDPTIGNTTIGGTSGLFGGDSIRIDASYTASENGTLSSISWHDSSASTNFAKGVVYSTDSLVDYTNATTSVSGWMTLNVILGASLAASTNYSIGVWFDGDFANFSYDAGTKTTRRDNTVYNAGSAPPSTFSQVSTIASRATSFYATYTASGGGGGTASEPEYSIIFQ